MGILFGFMPWIVYWVLVGNAPFTAAVVIALAFAVAALVIVRVQRTAGSTFEIGAVVTFSVLAILTLSLSQSFAQRWILPLSNLGIFVVALAGVLIGRPFVREFSQDRAKGEPLSRITTPLTWIWVAVFAGMAVSSSIAPILHGDATILDVRRPLSFVCYWIIPFTLLGVGALASQVLPHRMMAEADTVNRRTTFVAYGEATIDELYYLAQEHASREVGAGQEAYDVRVGGMGTPLVGDDSRKSWPSTYKVRARRR